METWNPEKLEQNVLAATDEVMAAAVTVMTLGFAPVEAGHRSVGSMVDIAPVMEFEEEGPEPARPEPLLWPMPQYPTSLGSIALGSDGLVHADDRQFALAA